VLVHIVDGSAGLWDDQGKVRTDTSENGATHPAYTSDPISDFKRINAELEQYDPDMAHKPQLVAINKIDIPDVRDRLPELEKQFRELGYEDIYPISAATGAGVKELIYAVAAKLRETPRPAWQEEAEESEEVVVRPQARHAASESSNFEVAQEGKGRYRVSGQRVERLVVMTDMNNPFALERLQRELQKMGVSKALEEAGVGAGDTVSFGRVELEWSDEPWVRSEQSTRRRHTGPGKQKS